jgi:hypothetical protein
MIFKNPRMNSMALTFGNIVSLAFTLAVTYFLVRLAFDIFVEGFRGKTAEGFENEKYSWDGDTLTLNGNVVVTGKVTVPGLQLTTQSGTTKPRWLIEPEGADDFYLVFRDQSSGDNRYAMYGQTYKNI